MQAKTIFFWRRMVWAAVLGSAAGVAAGQSAPDLWPMAQHDGRRSSQGAFPLVSKPFWRWEVAAGAPVIGTDGMLYVIDGRSVAAIFPNGSRAWTSGAVPANPDPYHKYLQELGIGQQASGAVIYLSTGGPEPAGQPVRSAVHAFNLSGSMRWSYSYKAEGSLRIVPAKSSEGCAVYAAVTPGGLECVNERIVSGALEPYRQWRYPASGEISVKSLAVASGGRAVFCAGQTLTSVTSSGAPQWTRPVACNEVVVADDGTIYVTTAGSGGMVDTVRSFTAAGVERWVSPLTMAGRNVSLAVANGTGGAGTHVLYVAGGSVGGTVVSAVNANQQVVWTVAVGTGGAAAFSRGLILAGDGGLVAGGGPGDDFLAKGWGPDGAERWRIRASGEPGFPAETGANIQALAMGGRGQLYGVNFSSTRSANILMALRVAEFGDSNENGRFEMTDLDRLVDIVLGRVPAAPGSGAFANSDVNGDEVVNMTDVNLYVDCLLKRIDRFPLQEAGSQFCVESGLTASYGDTNGDGSFNATDLNALVALILGNPLQGGAQPYVNSDVNRDGAVNQTDLNLYVDCLLGLVAAFPAQGAGSRFCVDPAPRGLGDASNVNHLAAPPTVTAKPGFPVYTVTANFTNSSAGTVVVNPYFVVKTLGGAACPCTVDGYGGQGAVIPVRADSWGWAPGESFRFPFPIRVTNAQQRFTFFVDLLGYPAGPGMGGGPPAPQ